MLAHQASPPVRAAAHRVRVTRRGRVLFVVLVVALLLGAFSIGRVSTRAAAPGAPAATTSVVVGSDDTLWSLAVRSRPHADPRDTVRLIERLNGLSSASVRPGQRLTVPNPDSMLGG